MTVGTFFSNYIHYKILGTAQNDLKEEDSGSGKAGSEHFLLARRRRPILLAAHKATFCSARRMSGHRNFPAGYAQPQASQPQVYYNFTEDYYNHTAADQDP
jgi:hypothetical protein